MKINLFPVLGKLFFVVGFALLFILAIPGIRGILFSILSFGIGAFAIAFTMKHGNRQNRNHSPLLFDFFIIAVLTAAFFYKEIPARIYSVIICWLICSILDIIYWLLDKQYEGKDFKQLLSNNFRFPIIADLLIIVINVNGLITGELKLSDVLAYLLVAFSLIDLFRQYKMVKSGKIDIKDLL